LRMSETTERRIDKLGKRDEADELFNKKVKIGTLEDIGAVGLDMWKGPAHYLPIQAVIKDSSAAANLKLVGKANLVHPGGGKVEGGTCDS
jgi:hypothetical protein